jgi:large-conductance mechanosensitive channel
LNKLVAPVPATEAAPPPSEEVLLLREIRDSLKSR